MKKPAILPPAGTPVRVYRNLHRRCFSVQVKDARGHWIVVAHVDRLTLTDVTFRVSEAGRQRVIREKAKNVHAYVYGRIAEDQSFEKPSRAAVTYNPYAAACFVWAGTAIAVNQAKTAWFDQGRFVTAVA